MMNQVVEVIPFDTCSQIIATKVKSGWRVQCLSAAPDRSVIVVYERVFTKSANRHAADRLFNRSQG